MNESGDEMAQRQLEMTNWINSTNETLSEGVDDEDIFGFVTEGILLTSVSIFGFFGNILSIWVLLKSSLKGNFSKQLTSLAGYDALFLIAAIATFGLPKIYPEYPQQNIYIYLLPICYGLVHTFRVGSVFSTLSVTLERFFAIVFPLRDVSCIKRWLIPFTTIFTIVFNFPKFFEISCSRDPETNKVVVSGSEMRQNHLYVTVYVVWGKLILTDILPYTVIVILNSFIISKIIKSSRFRSRVTSSLRYKESKYDVRRGTDACPTPSRESTGYFEKQRQEHKLGLLLLAVSLLFIVCQSFKMVPDLYEVVFCSDKSEPCIMTPFVETCLSLSHLLVCFNSSANFVIYLLAGEKFRRVWFDTFFRGFCINNNNQESGSNQANTMHTMSTIGRETTVYRSKRSSSVVAIKTTPFMPKKTYTRDEQQRLNSK